MPALQAEYITILVAFERLFSQRIWKHAKTLLIGAILSPAERTVTAALRVMGLSMEKHFQNYHRVLNRATWSSLEASFQAGPWWSPEWNWDSLRVESRREFAELLTEWISADADVAARTLLGPVEPVLSFPVSAWLSRSLPGMRIPAIADSFSRLSSPPSNFQLVRTPSLKASVDAFGASAQSTALTIATQGGSFTAAQVLAGVQAHMTASVQVNSKPHINTMTRAQNVNVYQVASGVYAYTSSMAIDTDGSDPDPDPDHQGQTTWQDNSGKALGAHTVPFYVLGDDCWDRTSPCPHFYYAERGITGLQFALMFYNGKCIGAVFGDTQTANNQTTSDNDSRELGEASAKAADLLGISRATFYRKLEEDGLTGGGPGTTGVYYDDTWNRALLPAGTTD